MAPHLKKDPYEITCSAFGEVAGAGGPADGADAGVGIGLCSNTSAYLPCWLSAFRYKSHRGLYGRTPTRLHLLRHHTRALQKRYFCNG